MPSRLILLGTGGGPTPKAHRAAPGQAVVVNGATYVVDCGNGVARQLVLAGLALGSIRATFITHHHSDHNADFGNLLLLSWAASLARPVDVYGPPPLADMTGRFLDLNAVDIAARMTSEGRPPLRTLIAAHDIAGPGPVMADENVTVTCALVDHRPMATALAFRFDCPDRSIVFSGDTRPSANLVRLAKGADVLVHEVVHLPSLDALITEEASARTLRAHILAAHTTTEEVGAVASEAGVKTLVLTHFIPGGVPLVPDEVWREAVAPNFAGEIIVGRDLLEI